MHFKHHGDMKSKCVKIFFVHAEYVLFNYGQFLEKFSAYEVR